MDLEQFLKTFLAVEKIVFNEDGTVTLSMLAERGKRRRFIDCTLSPSHVRSNTYRLNEAGIEIWSLEERWRSFDTWTPPFPEEME